MNDFFSYLKKAVAHAVETGITKSGKFIITGVFLDEKGDPTDIFIDSEGNNTEKFGMVCFLVKYLETKIKTFSEESMTNSSPEERSVSQSDPLSEEDRKNLSEYTKKLLDKSLTPQEREEYSNKVKDIMKKAVTKHKDKKQSPKITPEEEKKIRDFMEKFGKNFNPGGDFEEKDLTDLL